MKSGHIVIIVMAVVFGLGILVLCGCLASVLFLGQTAVSRSRQPPPAPTGRLPFDAPYEVVDCPPYNGSLEDLVPQRLGRFKLTESSKAQDSLDALATWSAFYHDEDGSQIHLRIQQFASPERAYYGMLNDDSRSISGEVTGIAPFEKGGRTVGTQGVRRYTNGLKNNPAETVMWTNGNLAFSLGSKDGLFAEECQKELEKQIRY